MLFIGHNAVPSVCLSSENCSFSGKTRGAKFVNEARDRRKKLDIHFKDESRFFFDPDNNMSLALLTTAIGSRFLFGVVNNYKQSLSINPRVGE